MFTDNLSPHQYDDTMHEVFAGYRDSIAIDPARSTEVLTGKEVANRFEHDHAVKWAPLFDEQIVDAARTNTFAYFEGQTPTSSIDIYRKIQEDGEVRFMSEQAALNGFARFVKAHAAQHYANEALSHGVESLVDDLTFIGEKEYREATQGIAEYWKHELRSDQGLQLCILTAVTDLYQSGDEQPLLKSDSYMLDRVLANFSDEDLEEFKGRLHATTTETLTTEQPENIKIIIMDDWTITGEQLQRARYRFLSKHPQFTSSLEVQFIVGREEDIKLGFTQPDPSGEERPAVPVRAYYAIPASNDHARITGVHSSVDYGFRHDVTRLALKAAEQGIIDQDATLSPALANIKRPYRMNGFVLENIARLQRISGD